ncbi:MAG: hypothetical protein FWH33_00120 [Oscillospiraceae bacterium]|nr:hypothetical protein [Oscillospiraceae bacterium]
MNNKTRMITLVAMLSALTIAVLYITSIWPTGQLGFAAVSSLFVAAAIIEMGIAPGLYVYVVSSLIGALVLPNRSTLLLFILFFGYYPIIKRLSEKLRSRAAQWALKLVLFNVALSVIWFALRGLVFPDFEMHVIFPVLYIGGNAVFIVFDYGYSKLLLFYMSSIHQRIKK